MPQRRDTLAIALLAVLVAVSCAHHRRAGTGDVAFRLAWQGLSDLDLLVKDPGGACIFYGHRRSASGGLLDVDCNAGTDRICAGPVENVYWPAGAAPPGRYRVWVRAHALLPVEAPLPYTLTVLRGRRVTWTHRGEMNEHAEQHGPFLYSFPGGGASSRESKKELSPSRACSGD